MTKPSTLTLSAFLLARIAEDEEREVVEVAPELPADVRDRLTLVQVIRLGHRLRAAGWATTSAFIRRRAAARYADHPDYRDEWRP